MKLIQSKIFLWATRREIMVCGEKQKFDGTENKCRLISRGEGGPVTSEQTV